MEASRHLPFKIERYDVFEFDGVDHRLVQQTADGHLILERMDTGVTLQVRDKLDGSLGLPTVGWVLDMMRDFRLMFRKPALPNDAREKQRKIEIDNAELRKMDPRVDARMSVVKYMDDNNIPMSDAKISAALDKLCTSEWMDKHKTRPGPSTVRLWMAIRGRPHDRRMSDMLSLKGASKRARKLHLTVLSVSSWHQLDYCDVLPAIHATDKLARQMETSDAAKPFYRRADHWCAARA